MMPGRVPCLPAENPLSLSWHDSAWVPMVNSSNVLDYFSERSNPFYDRTCNNETLKMQRQSPDQLVNMIGLEYILLHVQEPILYVIRKQHRTSPTQTVALADYYIIAGVVYQAPDLISVVNSRLLTTVFHLQSAFDDLFSITRYQPSKGYSWDVKAQTPAQGSVRVKKDAKEEPSSNFQRQRVDMLLMELTRRFPPPVLRTAAIEMPENHPENQVNSQENAVNSNVEVKQEIKEEPRMEQPITSPSMKPPPEKKPRLKITSVMNDINEEYVSTQKQIESSREEISNLIEECNEMVTNIRIANDLREINRRKDEKLKDEKRTIYLEEEAAKAQQKFVEINVKWEPISKYNDSIDIYNACEEQKKKCEDLLNCKNEVIETLKKDLSRVDERFINDQMAQRNDINLLSQRITKQIEILRNAYRKHLRLIEETVVEERANILEKYQSEWQHLNEKYEREEVHDMDARAQMVNEFEKEIDNMYCEHFEKYSTAKDDLEEELQKLQLDFEELKASCALDEHKLEYNYLVLTKRQKELVKIKSEQKQKINRLRDMLSDFRQKIDECEKKFKIESNKVNRELCSFEDDFVRNSDKIQRLSETNENTFKKVWQLNEKRAMKLLKKLFNTDKQIHEEVLHVEWKPIELKLLKLNELPSLKLAFQNTVDNKLLDEDFNDDQISEEKSILPRLSSDVNLTKFILRETAKNVDFLSYQIDELTKTLPENEQNLVNYDYILKILKIETKSQLELLKKYVTPHIECLTCKENSPKQSILSKYQETLQNKKRTGSGYQRKTHSQERPSSAPQTTSREDESFEIPIPKILCQNSQHYWYIDQFSLINALSDFILKMKQQTSEKKCTSTEKLLVSRILTQTDMEMFWEKFNENFSKEKEHVWNVIQKHFEEFLNAAQEKCILQEELKNLEKLNSEMKQLLHQFSNKIPCNSKLNS